MAAITQCARALTAERGLDGFTMDELAECAEVSRRTLFNYVPGKLDAVLGAGPKKDPAAKERFLAGGPTGDLLLDVKALALATLESEAPDPAEIDALRRIMRSDARLQALMHERFVEATELVSEAIAVREGSAVDPLLTRIILTVMVGLFDLTLDESLADPSVSFAEHFDRVFKSTSALFTTPSA